ncbi:SDR family oxidoreductase [Pseudomonas fluorescens]|uniref:SDR family oxidoreductase n=1 Tax=Pseudomonas fluorescens TaxID=294 RepID=A0A944DNL2_PSEFL|nr:SDR family oxidoreductase [Pseudomonas fluorescens]MBT2297673.1 SDR family oxidoreductase [Pseudomonas fluorescens]MBT2305872.1 SDR family oxidoreductase [Pseudomonas fluorescens]MBT2314106.1 SDR family oxidoreductase [Pseudomonas fluorescens]MBT2319402.1 SDR family oxidoreductase [Pseudomonas fluorescens]MBT2329180.1 SDR family oxidoreductase [Pseudomonas fluorescens]
MENRLASTVAVVTGAAQGIGAAIARLFVQEGCFVYVTDINDELGEAVASSLGDRACYLRLDVRREEDWQRVALQVLRERGSWNVLVNNAGITGFEQGAVPHDPEHASLEDWHAVHHTNLDGVFLGCKYAIRSMRLSGTGSIINISSRSGLVGIPSAAAYASSKAAVRNHSKTVALYCAEQGLKIRCNSIHPAATLTPMWEPMLGSGSDREERMAALVRDTPLRRFGMPEEVAAVALLLASNEATYITGSEFNIDGGLLAGTAMTPTVLK